MILYHVSFREVPVFIPRVPETRHPFEDGTTPRICFSTDIDFALSAIPCADMVHFFLDTLKIPPTIWVYQLDTDQLEPWEWEDWEQLGARVPDARKTHECWVYKELSLPFQKYTIQRALYLRGVDSFTAMPFEVVGLVQLRKASRARTNEEKWADYIHVSRERVRSICNQISGGMPEIVSNLLPELKRRVNRDSKIGPIPRVQKNVVQIVGSGVGTPAQN